MPHLSTLCAQRRQSRNELARDLSAGWAVALVVATSVLPALGAARLAAGTYRQISPNDARILAVGNELVILDSGDGRRRFSLNAIRPSDNNTGYIDGALAPKAGPQTWTSERRDARCRLVFVPLAHRRMKITQDLRFGDCGFGYGVTAAGTYARTRATGKLGPWNGP